MRHGEPILDAVALGLCLGIVLVVMVSTVIGACCTLDPKDCARLTPRCLAADAGPDTCGGCAAPVPHSPLLVGAP